MPPEELIPCLADCEGYKISELDADFYGRAVSTLLSEQERSINPRTRQAIAIADVIGTWTFRALVMTFACWFLAMAIDRTPPSVIHSHLLSPRIHPGDPLRVAIDLDRHRMCEVSVSWKIFDGLTEERRFGPEHVDANGTIRHEPPYVRLYATPRDAEPGQARLRVIRSYECPGNLLHPIYPIVEVERDIPFTIVANGKPL